MTGKSAFLQHSKLAGLVGSILKKITEQIVRTFNRKNQVLKVS